MIFPNRFLVLFVHIFTGCARGRERGGGGRGRRTTSVDNNILISYTQTILYPTMLGETLNLLNYELL